MTKTLGATPRAALGIALDQGEFTRKEIADQLGVSFPSVTASIGELVRRGFVREVRREQGPRGRASLVYGVTVDAGWVLGVDIGSTQVTCIAHGLDGTERVRQTVRVPRDVDAAGTASATLIREMVDSLGAPRAITIAVNQIVPHSLHAAGYDWYPVAPRLIERALDGVTIPPEVPIAVENNVNCAAVAEHEDGALEGLTHCAYLQAGVGIGLGYFTAGALVRGGTGASGEVAQVPLSWDAEVETPRDAIEDRYGSAGMVRRAAELMGAAAPTRSEDIFLMAEQGDAVAQEIMREHAVAIGRVAVAAATILDPVAIVVGGGLAKNLRFVDLLREEFTSLMPRIDVRHSEKGDDASAQGAVLIARDLALAALVGPQHQRLVPHPALWSTGESESGAA